MGQRRAGRAGFEQFVDLLLVLGISQPDFGVGDGEHIFGTGGVLVQRNGYRAQRLRGKHRRIQAGAVGTDHHHMVTGTQTALRQTGRQLRHQLREIAPTQGLPDAIFLFAHSGSQRPLRRVMQQELRKRRLHAGSYR